MNPWAPSSLKKGLAPRFVNKEFPACVSGRAVALADWKPELSYNEQPPENIRYDVKWKLSVNNRQRSGESESGIQDLTSMDRARGRCITRTNYNIAPARLPTRCWVKIDI